MAGTGTIGAEIWEQAIDRQDARACCLAPFGRADERGRSGPPAAIERGDNRADIDRDTAQLALTDVVAFFLDHRIEAQPLVRLLGELAALSAGSKPSPMLKAATTRHRSPDPPIIQSVKGRLAAIMEFRQKTGSSRRAAREWVARNIPSKTTRRLGSVTPSAVDSWLSKWGGERPATSGDGREGYKHMRAILESRKPTEKQLKLIMATLAESLPAPESK